MITAEDIGALFADLLGQIESDELRKKVVSTWVAACDQGRWKRVEEIEEMPSTLLTDTHGIGFVAHTKAVTAGALGLARAQLEHCTLPYEIDIEWLIAGGLLHDVGKLMEFERKGDGYRKSHAGKCARHPISGAILAAQHGIPQEILNMIICHSKEGDGRPQRVETVLIHQADFGTFNPLVMLNKGNLILAGQSTDATSNPSSGGA